MEDLINGGLSTALIAAAIRWDIIRTIHTIYTDNKRKQATVILPICFLGGLMLSAIKRSLGVKD